jgi:hypothetical protein
MNRRGFLSGIIAAGMAPAVVGSGILMPLGKVWVPERFDLRAFERARLTMYMEQAERAAMDVLVYGVGGVLIGTDGNVRALGPSELYKTRTADEIVMKARWADLSRQRWGR